MLEHVAHVRAAVVAANLVTPPDTDVRPVARVVAFGVRVPAGVGELRLGRVERFCAGSAREVPLLGEEAAELPPAVTLGAAPPQDLVFLRREGLPPLLVRLLVWIG